MSGRVVTPKVGRTYELAEQDYRYGVGPLIARVVRVFGDTTFDGEPWWEVAAYTAWGTTERHGNMGEERRLHIRARVITAGPAS